MYELCIYERFEESLQTVAEHLGEKPSNMETSIAEKKEKNQYASSWMRRKFKNRQEREER